jgi:hypothetical protein
MDLSRKEVNKGFFDIGNVLSYDLPNGFNLANLRWWMRTVRRLNSKSMPSIKRSRESNEALPIAYARLPEKDGYPPDHWVILLSNDERMETNGRDIVYRDGKKLLEKRKGSHRDLRVLDLHKESKGRKALVRGLC